jgi:hypothetical protein
VDRRAVLQIGDLRPARRLTPATATANAPATEKEIAVVLLASAFDQSKYWRADDLTAPKRLKIKKVTAELVGRGNEREQKLVVWFVNEDRGLILNKTNNRTMRGAFGDDTAKWIGRIIELFPTLTEMAGEMTPALRVRIPPPKQAASGNGSESKPQLGEDPPKRPIRSDDPDADFDDEIPSEGGESLSDQ